MFSWVVTAFETYLLCVFLLFTSSNDSRYLDERLRQFPLYSKDEPPAILAAHITPEVFKKSQQYGRDKAKFSLVSGLYKQCLDSAILQLGFYAWSWSVAGKILLNAGYGPEYEVSRPRQTLYGYLAL